MTKNGPPNGGVRGEVESLHARRRHGGVLERLVDAVLELEVRVEQRARGPHADDVAALAVVGRADVRDI